MFLLIVSIILGLIALGCLGTLVLFGSEPDFPKIGTMIGGVVIGFIAFALLLGSMLRIVPPRSVGIQVTLGKVESTLDSGPHMVKPWSKVENFPSTMQVTKLLGDGKGKDYDGAAVTVRLANQTTAQVHVSSNWQINTQNGQDVERLYATWRSFDAIEEKLVVPQLQHALQAPFEKYDPLSVLKVNGELVAPTKQLEEQVKAELAAKVGDGVRIDNLTIQLISYDQVTQDKINGYSQAVADTRIAEQRKSTATAQREANDALAGSGASKDPGVLYQNCIDMTERLTKEGKGLPAAWSCGDQAQTVVPVR